MIKKHGEAHWSGGLKDGLGTVSLESGAMTGQAYGFAKRFSGETGTNPEELIGAAHASCFSMQLSAFLEKEGATATAIDTRSTVTLVPGEGITAIHLDVTVAAPIDEAKFREVAERAKVECPVSKLLSGSAEITMDARLAG